MFLGGIFNLFDKDPNYSMGAFGVGVGIICGGAFLYARRSQKERLSFLEWLIENRQSLIDGVTALYKGIPISITSELVTYQFCFSFIFYTVKLPSQFFVIEHEVESSKKFTYSLFTFLLGWWGFPFGPIYTIQVLYSNLRGGIRQTISELVRELSMNKP
jgi:hypothetical protein